MGEGSKRNLPCPCGSGRKYKDCCYNKLLNFDKLKLTKEIKASFKGARIKKCYFSDDGKCSEKIIQAHSIQNNRILNRIAENGYVMAIDFLNADNLEIPVKERGRKITGIFNGFCSYHDESIFHDIENNNYAIGNKKQEFLFAFRAFIYEFYKKENNILSIESLYRKNLIKNMELAEAFLLGTRKAIEDGSYYLKLFKDGIREKKYDGIDSFSFKLKSSYLLAVNSMFGLEFDLSDNLINDLLSKERLKHICLNIFPRDNETYVIFSWLKEDKDSYKDFKKDMLKLKKDEMINVLNNIIATYIENFVIGPKLWNNLNSSEKEGFWKVFTETITRSPYEKTNLRTVSKFNLFRKI